MLRSLLITALAAAFAAVPAGAADRVLLMPGVTYERQVEFTAHGPVAIHVINAPKPGGLWSLRPVLSNGALLGKERVTAMQRSLAGQATVAGVNGDFFVDGDGRPQGIFLQGGVLAHPPHRDRSSIGIGTDGMLRIQGVRMFGTWRGTGQRRPLDLNEVPGTNGVSLFTPQWGPTTPISPGAVAAVIPALPQTVPNVEHVGTVSELRPGNGGVPIPPGGAVILARGTGAQRLAAEAAVGSAMTVRLLLSPDWGAVPEALGGGPTLVRAGKPVFRHGEVFSVGQLTRAPRAAVGQLADGRILLVAVDGQQRGYSVGMSSFELARTMVRLGAVSAAGLDVGGSTTMAFDGTLLNRPSDRTGERAVSEGLFVVYGGVYAAPPSEAVVSPNGDGVAESVDLAYKVVRPSRVTVTVVGPGRTERRLDAADKEAGTYKLTWDGRSGDAPEPEGRWRFTVTATDAAGEVSTAERLFSLNRTLGALSVSPNVATLVRPLLARFTLTRPALVTAAVETRSGALLGTVSARRFSAGTHSVSWTGRLGTDRLRRGGYVLRVTAANDVGEAELTAPVSVR